MNVLTWQEVWSSEWIGLFDCWVCLLLFWFFVFVCSFCVCFFFNNQEWTNPSLKLLCRKIHCRKMVLNKTRSFLHWQRRWKYRYLGLTEENLWAISVPEHLWINDHFHQPLDYLTYVDGDCTLLRCPVCKVAQLQGTLILLQSIL